MKGTITLCLVALTQMILTQAMSVAEEHKLENDLEEVAQVKDDDERRQIALLLLDLIDASIAQRDDDSNDSNNNADDAMEKRRISGVRAWNKLPPSVLKSQGKRMRKLQPSVLFHH